MTPVGVAGFGSGGSLPCMISRTVSTASGSTVLMWFLMFSTFSRCNRSISRLLSSLSSLANSYTRILSFSFSAKFHPPLLRLHCCQYSFRQLGVRYRKNRMRPHSNCSAQVALGPRLNDRNCVVLGPQVILAIYGCSRVSGDNQNSRPTVFDRHFCLMRPWGQRASLAGEPQPIKPCLHPMPLRHHGTTHPP